jgi:uncharacterized protein (DUF2267 family)
MAATRPSSSSRLELARKLIERVCARGPATPRQARRSIEVVLRSLGAMLTAEERLPLTTVLPAPCAQAVSASPSSGARTGSVERLYTECADAGPVAEASRERELAQVVCAALGEVVPLEVRSRLTRALPVDVASLFAFVEATPFEPPQRPRGHTIASGRPGSRHPLADSAPLDAQSDSVAEPNPHGDTKVSSATGATQERLHESLADGGAESSRTIASATDKT